WLFNKQAILKLAGLNAGYVSLIISAAAGFLDRPNEELVQMAVEDLQACFPGAGRLTPTRSQVVRERDATVSLTPETEKLRPGPKTPLANLFLAGDWTATGLPATIESAVLSGERAAQLLLDCK
ncbi:MAG: FAD-dependent oxidoreductase, partial [Candidatus Omnitrophota bacterium]|nr:FAD-dependent oxidoreductase [Candidatus Omnitrophota bacterium]